MNRKNIAGLIAALLLLSTLLTACNNHTENIPTDTSGTEANSSEIGSDHTITTDPQETEPAETEPSFVNPAADEFTVPLNNCGTYGEAVWDSVGGAEYYLCKVYTVDDGKRVDVKEYTLALSQFGGGQWFTYLPRGYGVEVIPLDADRQAISTEKRLISDIFSRVNYRDDYWYPSNTPEVHPVCDVLWSDLKAFNVLESIDPASIVNHEDGSLTFTSTLSDGKSIRFFGKDVEYKDGTLYFSPYGRIWGLDALGRIFACDISTVGDFAMAFSLYYCPAYSFSTDKTSVDSPDELYTGRIDSNNSIDYAVDFIRIPGYVSQGNFFSLSLMDAFGQDPTPVAISEIIVYYDTETYVTPLKAYDFDRNYTRSYVTGELYDPSRERYDPSQNIYDFYLEFCVDASDLHTDSDLYATFDSDEQFVIGDLRDKDGNVLDKDTDGLTPGATIDVTVGDYTLPAPLWVLPRVDDAHTWHELVSSAYPEAVGDINVLVVPLVWQDTPEFESAENLTAIYNMLGRVMTENGNVTDHSDGDASNGYSLSEYFGTASYGKLKLTSLVTDWCYLPRNAQDNYFALDHATASEIIDRVYQAYPDMDFSSFDKDQNGYFDSVVFLNVMTNGTMTRNFYTPMAAGDAQKLGINCYINLPESALTDYTLIHEFGHNLGLIDYYDVTYSGINAIGSFDMQSNNKGDWNPYSKYSVGWITPEVVTDLAPGQSVEFEIGAFADTGDAIVIPGAESTYNGTPFGEYIIIDLFSDRGLGQADAESFGLGDALGVRIYHVNSVMEGRTLSRDGAELSDEEIATADEVYPIGTANKTNVYNETGSYHIELIQAGKDNTFTDLQNLRTNLQKEDLFEAGDVFSVPEYAEFFHNGLLDDRTDFGYTIEIVSITEGEIPTATIRITRN